MADGDDPTGYVFSMDKWLPDTIPARRLGQYIEKLAQLFGEQDSVHFTKVTKGSARAAFKVEVEAAAKVWDRLQSVSTEGADRISATPADLLKIRKDVNRMLMEDGCTGTLKTASGATIIKFLGRKTPIADEVTLHETGDLEGTLVGVGGRDETVPVQIDAGGGRYYHCNTNRDTAKRLAPYLFEGRVRLSGKGKWHRSTEGEWTLKSFDVADFVALDKVPLSQLVDEMRAVEGSGWNSSEDPHADLKRIRED